MRRCECALVPTACNHHITHRVLDGAVTTSVSTLVKTRSGVSQLEATT